MTQQITVEVFTKAPVEKVWRIYTEPDHIMQWNSPSPDWHTPRAENDLRVGGQFVSRMEARDGSAGFDFAGVYDEVVPYERFSYTMSDGRKVSVTFADEEGDTRLTVKFDPETENTLELQRSGWQTILDNFKRYVESQ